MGENKPPNRAERRLAEFGPARPIMPPEPVPQPKSTVLLYSSGLPLMLTGFALLFTEGFAAHMASLMLFFSGASLIARAIWPRMFVNIEPVQIIAGIPEKRSESKKSWVLVGVGVLTLSLGLSWVYQAFGPPSLSQRVLTKLGEMSHKIDQVLDKLSNPSQRPPAHVDAKPDGKPKDTALKVDEPRIRITNVIPAPPSATGLKFPVINIEYDNAGPGVARGTSNRTATGFGGDITQERMFAEQDALLRWEGWKHELESKNEIEIQPGDPGRYTTMPNQEGPDAENFRKYWDAVGEGKTRLWLFTAFKSLDSRGHVQVTEACFWLSYGYALHTCGRTRSFMER